MPNVPQMIRSVARHKHIQQYIVEKDYALSYLLAAIVQADGLGENLVLKGGTALKKLYFADYRFSEDLDYSTRVMGLINRHTRETPANELWQACGIQRCAPPMLLTSTGYWA
jgi:predicted nucleotidyltransferase component of viral defense system